MFVSPNKITPLLQSIFYQGSLFSKKKIERINELQHITVPVRISGTIFFEFRTSLRKLLYITFFKKNSEIQNVLHCTNLLNAYKLQ